MFRDLRAGRGQIKGELPPRNRSRWSPIKEEQRGHFRVLRPGLVRKNAQDALHGACPIVASFGGKDRFLPTAPQRLEQALQALKSSPSACRITRTSTLCAICSVRVDSCGANAASVPWTWPAVSSASLTVPSSSFRAFTIVPRYKVTVRAESPSTP
jgi:hypothetical protein